MNKDTPDASGHSPAVLALAARTRLSARTVEDLLASGWRYRDEIGSVPNWEHPLWALRSALEAARDAL